MLACLDCILLSRKAESVITHGVKDIETLQSFVTGENVTGDIAQRMPDMEPRTGRIRKHVENIELWFGRVRLGPESTFLRPIGLPFAFNFPEIVIHYLSVIS